MHNKTMAIKKKVTTKKKSGSGVDSAAVSKVLPMKGGKKVSDNSTSYGKTNTYKKQPVPNYPYGGVPPVVKKKK